MRATNRLILSSSLVLASMSVLSDETPGEPPSSALADELSREFHLDGPRASVRLRQSAGRSLGRRLR